MSQPSEIDAHAYRSELLACACGVEMPLTDSGEPTLTFEEWIEYHDGVLECALERDARQYEEEGRWMHPVDPPPPPYIPAGGGSRWVLSPNRVTPPVADLMSDPLRPTVPAGCEDDDDFRMLDRLMREIPGGR